MDGRIFGLDIQLGFDVIMQGIAVFIMFALLSYILFEPVRKILEDRKNRIANEIDQAAADQAEAAKLKAEYDHKLKNVEKEADALMAQARKKALKREEEIVAGAKEEAARIIESANHEAELAKIGARDEFAIFINMKEDSYYALPNIASLIEARLDEEGNKSIVNFDNLAFLNNLDDVDSIEIYYNGAVCDIEHSFTNAYIWDTTKGFKLREEV